MTGIGIAGLASYLPANQVGSEFFTELVDPADLLAHNPMFRPPKFRHHVAEDETGADMISHATDVLFSDLGHDAIGNIDAIITNVLLPDIPITGSGAEVSHRLGVKPEWILDVHNGGCASFVLMLKLAATLLATSDARAALLCNVQNSGGQVFSADEVRRKSHAAIPGDGCGVAYVVKGGGSPVLGFASKHYGENAADMSLTMKERKYWQPGTEATDILFTESKVAKIIGRGNELVPDVVQELGGRVGFKSGDIDKLVTNQPNRMFLRNWREALEVEPENHLDTFDEYGNLFGAGVPVTLDHANRKGELHDGDLVVMAGFAHAGDFAAASAMRWSA